jgi:hypothetical protein
MSKIKIQEWVDNASDQTIVKVFDTQDPKKAMTVWSTLANDADVAVRIHEAIDARKLVNFIQSHECFHHNNHESMVPECAKAEFNYPTSTPSVGDLVNGVSLCLDVEDPFFPFCLKDSKLSHELNFEITSYQWVPTAIQAYKSRHYDWKVEDNAGKHATGNACRLTYWSTG